MEHHCMNKSCKHYDEEFNLNCSNRPNRCEWLEKQQKIYESVGEKKRKDGY